MKNKKINQWFWRWHCIAGLITLPFILLLSITGIIYLFKADYEKPRQQHIKEVTVQGSPISFQQQWELAKQHSTRKIDAVILPKRPTQATEFVSGRFGGTSSLYVDPYQAKVTGTIAPREGFMFTIRKLHGELLLGKFGTTLVELVANWMVVLIFTGLYIWWPSKGWKLKGFFIPRVQEGKRIFFRDTHAIMGFWFSILLLMILAGGFPWTEVFGANFKWLQKTTHTGFPSTWHGHQLHSRSYSKETISLDEIIAKAKALQLPGAVRIDFPKGPKGIYSISNTYPQNLSAQQKIHYDQYSGASLLRLQWCDVGILMRARMWFMAFHQGEFGPWNWVLVLCTAIGLLLMSVAAIASYLLRKRKNNWSIPKSPSNFTVGYPMIGILILLGIVFPLFGISIVLIVSGIYLRNQFQKYPGS